MFHRYLILVAAILMQACLGATYSWSVFVTPLKHTCGISQATAQWPFTIFYIAFPATMIGSGFLLRKLGPRGCATLGGLIFGLGWIVASIGHFDFGFTVAGIGLLAGIGVGLAYMVPISVGMRWFPRNKGLVTGIAVAGFGGGAALVSHLADYLMTSLGHSPFQVFRTFGVIFLFLIVIVGLLMRYPPGHMTEPELPMKVGQVLCDRVFRRLYLAMFAGLVAGFAINANLKQLNPHIEVQSGAAAVALFAIANAAGRIGWGFAFDRLLSTAALRWNLLAQAVMMLAAPMLIRTPQGLYVLAALAGFNYGGVLVLYASSAAQRWGPQHVGQVYGWLFSANIPASFAPTLAAFSYDHTASFTPALLIIAGILIVSAFQGCGKSSSQ